VPLRSVPVAGVYGYTPTGRGTNRLSFRAPLALYPFRNSRPCCRPFHQGADLPKETGEIIRSLQNNHRASPVHSGRGCGSPEFFTAPVMIVGIRLDGRSGRSLPTVKVAGSQRHQALPTSRSRSARPENRPRSPCLHPVQVTTLCRRARLLGCSRIRATTGPEIPHTNLSEVHLHERIGRVFEAGAFIGPSVCTDVHARQSCGRSTPERHFSW